MNWRGRCPRSSQSADGGVHVLMALWGRPRPVRPSRSHPPTVAARRYSALRETD